MNKQSFEFVASVKKFATQASKGGSIILTLEMPLTDDNCLLSAAQNKDCVVMIKFDNDSIERANGQNELDFDRDPQAILIKGKLDPDVNYRYLDEFTGEVINAHLPLQNDVEDDNPSIDEVFDDDNLEEETIKEDSDDEDVKVDNITDFPEEG
jgi:hypothetical protein